MSLLEDLNTVLAPLNIPLETGIFSEEASDSYIVAVPLTDEYGFHADNAPGIDVQEVRLSLYSKSSYTAMKNAVVNALLAADYTITARQYIGFETDTGYHHYNVDVANYYEMEE